MFAGLLRRFYLMPIASFLLLLTCFAISYTIAVNNNHVYPIWPYISDTGALAPESCYFGQILNIAALLVGITLTARMKQLELLMKATNKDSRIVRIFAKISFILALVMMLGMSMVANFQETNILAVHLIGAYFAFVVGGVFFMLHTALSAIVNNGNSFGFKLNIFRGIMCVLSVITFIMMIVFTKLSMEGVKGGTKEMMNMNPTYPGYDYRLVATFSEWGLAASLGFNILTLTFDFWHLGCDIKFADNRCRKVDPLSGSNGISC